MTIKKKVFKKTAKNSTKRVKKQNRRSIKKQTRQKNRRGVLLSDPQRVKYRTAY